jgi:hypothetical protein
MHSAIIIFLIGLLGYEITYENEKDNPEKIVNLLKYWEF